ncbi:hypothetical protein PU629_18955 [Pullulanibacillus sp. KACC 23026]|uniref:hypothetical protein n=1 Tax=Pullulanibacillus sp. KACC 23026 TaxID=3028315 RepID=UPI0023B0F28D|nr:hypothetical protein [Pullulanibacillus sp. KACC 23026]WEG12174.1 hypothetical protein PU629_18955 [Pullulanibacillus sp. KACC 23026]
MGLVKKLLIKEGFHVTVVNAPADFQLPTEELPSNVSQSVGLEESHYDLILLFVSSSQELAQYVPLLIPKLDRNTYLWVAFPKKSSKIKTDINRDHGWERIEEAGYLGVSLISIDDTWSAFRVRHKSLVKTK